MEFLSCEWLLTLELSPVDRLKRQTVTATPAKPGGLPLTLAVLSAWHVKADISAGRLIPVHLEDAIPEEQTIWALYPTKRQVLPKVRIFVSEIKLALAEQG